MDKPQTLTLLKFPPAAAGPHSLTETEVTKNEGWRAGLRSAHPFLHQAPQLWEHPAENRRNDPLAAVQTEQAWQQTAQPFNVTEALRTLTIRPSLGTKDNITILTLNMDGLRTKYKKESLLALTHHLQFTIGVITETNLLPQEVDALTIPKYQILDKMGNSKHKGGVMIMAKIGVACTVFKRVKKPPSPIDTCSVLLYPTGREDYVIQITGVYIPPSALITGERLQTLTAPGCRAETEAGRPYSHLLLGDFNPNCWAENASLNYQEWTAEQGLWNLSDPKLPTYVTGSSLDKMLLYPGQDIPEEWLGPQTGEPVDTGKEPPRGGGELFYPALVFSNPWIADHHPLQISISGIGEQHALRHKVLKIKHLEVEDWAIKNDQFLDFCHEHRCHIANAILYENPTRLLNLIQQGLWKTLSDCLRKSKETRPTPERSPFHKFCQRHRHHPDYPMLINAIQQTDLPQASRIMTGMSRDGWREYLSKTHPSDISAFFKYLAKEDGRNPRQCTYSCSAPLKDPTGARHFDPSKKCALLAEFLEAKLAAPDSSWVVGDHATMHQSQGDPTSTARPPKQRPNRPSRYKRKNEEEFLPFNDTEVYRAVRSLAKKKAAGPDGFPAEVYQQLPGVLRPLRELFNLIIKTGHIPLPMLQLYIVPLDKPNKDPEECKNKRPISLLNTLSKALEALVLGRMAQEQGMEIDGRQYAYCPDRGTEIHLTEFHDYVREAAAKREHTYVAAIDVDSAFDSVPHNRLLQTVEERNVNGYICQYIHNWLRKRLFAVRLNSSTGRFLSAWKKIGKGVPQGGVLSPYLWNLHIDRLFEGVTARRRAYMEQMSLPPMPPILDSLYADDVLTAIAHKSPCILEKLSHISARAYKESLEDLGLSTTVPKSANLVIEATEELGPLFKRAPDDETPLSNVNVILPSQGVTVAAQDSTQGRRQQTALEPILPSTALPYTKVPQIKILGVIFDERFSFEEHYNRLLERAQVRMGVITRLCGYKWGLETRMLRLTGQSLVISLLKYGYTVTGSGLTELQLHQLNTRLLNPLARRIVGVGPSARLPILYAMAGILTSHNSYIQLCGEMLNRILRANGSSAQTMVVDRLTDLYAVPGWNSQPHPLPRPSMAPDHIGRLKHHDYDVPEEWTIQLLPMEPTLPPSYWIHSVFHVEAREIENKPNLRDLTYRFQHTKSWMDIAVQILNRAGWRPDCSLDSDLDMTKMLPPHEKAEKICVEMGGCRDHETSQSQVVPQKGSPLSDNQAIMSDELAIATGAFYQQGHGVSAAVIREPGKLPHTQVWGLGTDTVSSEPPAFVLEASILHALLLTEGLLREHALTPKCITLTTGTWRTCHILSEWQKRGTLALRSAAAPEIAKTWHRLNNLLPCKLVIRAIPREYLQIRSPWDSSEGNLLRMAAARFFALGVGEAQARWKKRIARIPWTTAELKRHLKRRYREDECAALGILALEGSTASINYCQMGLNRAILKECLRRLHHNRREQVVLANIICATRFKFFQKDGSLLHVQCPNGCGSVDSLDHLLACYKMDALNPEGTFDEKVSFLSSMAIKTTKNCPTLPVPFLQSPHETHLEADEISLSVAISVRHQGRESPGSAQGTEGSEMELEFDGQGERW